MSHESRVAKNSTPEALANRKVKVDARIEKIQDREARKKAERLSGRVLRGEKFETPVVEEPVVEEPSE